MAKKSNIDEQAQKLLDGLNFVSIAQETKGELYKTHCAIDEHSISATNGTISAGYPIETGLSQCFPETESLKSVLCKCKSTISIAQLDNEQLSIKSGRFKSVVDCIADFLPVINPDSECGKLEPSFLDAIKTVLPIANEKGNQIEISSILIQSGSCVATDRKFIIEAWHGCDMPTVVLPKAGADAIKSCKLKPVSFGFSRDSATFFFENGAWLKTQLFNKPWQDVKAVLETESNLQDIPADFFEAFDSVNDGDNIYLSPTKMESEKREYEIELNASNICVASKYLNMIKPFATKIDFSNSKGNIAFAGKNIRGCFAPKV